MCILPLELPRDHPRALGQPMADRILQHHMPGYPSLLNLTSDLEQTLDLLPRVPELWDLAFLDGLR